MLAEHGSKWVLHSLIERLPDHETIPSPVHFICYCRMTDFARRGVVKGKQGKEKNPAPSSASSPSERKQSRGTTDLVVQSTTGQSTNSAKTGSSTSEIRFGFMLTTSPATLTTASLSGRSQAPSTVTVRDLTAGLVEISSSGAIHRVGGSRLTKFEEMRGNRKDDHSDNFVLSKRAFDKQKQILEAGQKKSWLGTFTFPSSSTMMAPEQHGAGGAGAAEEFSSRGDNPTSQQGTKTLLLPLQDQHIIPTSCKTRGGESSSAKAVVSHKSHGGDKSRGDGQRSAIGGIHVELAADAQSYDFNSRFDIDAFDEDKKAAEEATRTSENNKKVDDNVEGATGAISQHDAQYLSVPQLGGCVVVPEQNEHEARSAILPISLPSPDYIAGVRCLYQIVSICGFRSRRARLISFSPSNEEARKVAAGLSRGVPVYCHVADPDITSEDEVGDHDRNDDGNENVQPAPKEALSSSSSSGRFLLRKLRAERDGEQHSHESAPRAMEAEIGTTEGGGVEAEPVEDSRTSTSAVDSKSILSTDHLLGEGGAHFQTYYAEPVACAVRVHGGDRTLCFQLHQNGWISVKFTDAGAPYKLPRRLVRAAAASIVDSRIPVDLEEVQAESRKKLLIEAASDAFAYFTADSVLESLSAEAEVGEMLYEEDHAVLDLEGRDEGDEEKLSGEATDHKKTADLEPEDLRLFGLGPSPSRQASSAVNKHQLVATKETKRPRGRYVTQKGMREREIFLLAKANARLFAEKKDSEVSALLFRNAYTSDLQQRVVTPVTSPHQNSVVQQLSDDDVDLQDDSVPPDEPQGILLNRFSNLVNFLLDLSMQGCPTAAEPYLREALCPGFEFAFLRADWHNKGRTEKEDIKAIVWTQEAEVALVSWDTETEEFIRRRYDFWR
ncbi:unnamed protein product [Amoebophrya sp. A25]|nr:unnamed protein product [Amoebophrya sp. A25]|eukprot:GSA25T00021773001.1